MKDLIIVRGASGSGKTTFARTFTDHVLVEADQYFMDDDGHYNFDPSKLKDAHSWCQQRVKSLLAQGEKVVVANTFTRLWEMEFYINLGYEFEVYRLTTQYQNVHGVPDHIVQGMLERFEDFPGENLV